MKTRITDLFFDLDDTLWDFQTNSASAFAYIFKKRNLSISSTSFLQVYQPINERYWQDYRSGKITKTRLRLGRLTDTFSEMSIAVSAELIQQIAKDYNRHLNDFTTLMPGVKETLTYLSEKYRLHILTNGFAEVQDRKLKNAEIMQYFQTITASEESGAKKPEPAIFKEALTRAQASKNSSVMIGDNLETDILGALNFGLSAIYFNPKQEQGFAGTQIHTIAQLKELF